jgi:hypothetical protein
MGKSCRQRNSWKLVNHTCLIKKAIQNVRGVPKEGDIWGDISTWRFAN